MTRPDLDAITARADAATVGPWIPRNGTPTSVWKKSADTWTDLALARYIDPYDADFIAAARTDVPVLVEYVRALEAAIADAPHDGDCDMLQSPYIRGFARVRECNCWKADYDAAKEAPHE